MSALKKQQTNPDSMDIFTAIETRRSNGLVTDAPVSEKDIQTLLQAATWAPTHKRSEPWRFHVFMNEGRDTLAEAIRQGGKEEKARKVYRAPVVIGVVSAPGRAAKNPPEWEDHAATAAAVQNMALATHGLGLAGFWKSGDVTEYPAVKELLEVDESYGDRIMAFFYIGHPNPDLPQPERPTPDWQQKATFYK